MRLPLCAGAGAGATRRARRAVAWPRSRTTRTRPTAGTLGTSTQLWLELPEQLSLYNIFTISFHFTFFFLIWQLILVNNYYQMSRAFCNDFNFLTKC